MTLRAVRRKQRTTLRYRYLHLIRRDERGGLFLPCGVACAGASKLNMQRGAAA